MSLSRHFSLDELVRSDTAIREGIPNQPDAGQIAHLRALCEAVLDPLRDEIGRPIRVTSGFRGPQLNARIGGSPTSQHSLGQAADLQAPGMDVLELFKTVVRMGLPFDQVIYEAQSATVRWVHVSHKPGANRGEIRVAQFNAAGKPVAYPMINAAAALAMGGTRAFGLAEADPGYEEHADEPVARADTPPARQPRPAAKKTAAPARKATAKKAPAQKAAAQKAPARTAPAKKAPAGKAATETAAKKVVARKVVAKQVVAKKVVARKAAAKKVATEKVAAKKVAAKKAAAKAASRPRRTA